MTHNALHVLDWYLSLRLLDGNDSNHSTEEQNAQSCQLVGPNGSDLEQLPRLFQLERQAGDDPRKNHQ